MNKTNSILALIYKIGEVGIGKDLGWLHINGQREYSDIPDDLALTKILVAIESLDTIQAYNNFTVCWHYENEDGEINCSVYDSDWINDGPNTPERKCDMYEYDEAHDLILEALTIKWNELINQR